MPKMHVDTHFAGRLASMSLVSVNIVKLILRGLTMGYSIQF